MSAIKKINIGSKIPKVVSPFITLSREAEKLMTELKEKQDAFDSNELLFFVANKKYFDFRVFKDPYKFASIIYHKGSLDDAKDSQNKMLAKLDEFKK